MSNVRIGLAESLEWTLFMYKKYLDIQKDIDLYDIADKLIDYIPKAIEDIKEGDA